MKRGTTPTLKIKLGVSHSDVSTVDFVFKQELSESAPALLVKAYPSDVTYDSTNDLYVLSLTEPETRLFEGDQQFYMDTRILLTDNKIPETKIVSLTMSKTLFEWED